MAAACRTADAVAQLHLAGRDDTVAGCQALRRSRPRRARRWPISTLVSCALPSTTLIDELVRAARHQRLLGHEHRVLALVEQQRDAREQPGRSAPSGLGSARPQHDRAAVDVDERIDRVDLAVEALSGKASSATAIVCPTLSCAEQTRARGSRP